MANPDLPGAPDLPPRRTFGTSLLLIAAVSFLVATVRFLLIFPYTPDDLILNEEPAAADAIILLEGSYARITRALDLVEAGYSDLIVYPGLLPESRGVLESRAAGREIDFELLSLSGTEGTFDEALNALALLRDRPEIGTVLLVTSTYHSFRSHWIFRKVLPRRIRIVPVTTVERWWDPERAAVPGTSDHRMFRREQYKFAGYFFLYGWRLFL